MKKKINYKSGITLASIAMYCILFFFMTTFTVVITNNYNHNTLIRKGNIFVNTEYDKLYYNLLNSAKESISFYKTESYISFSNGDVYEYDSIKQNVLKNGGILVSNVTSFLITNVDVSKLINTTDYNYTLEESKCIEVDIKIQKYSSIFEDNLIVTVGDEI